MATWEVIHGDCLDVLRSMPDASVDAVVTSPPYNLGKHHNGNKQHDPYPDNLPEEEYQTAQVAVLTELHRIASHVFYNHKNRIRNGEEISPRDWIRRTPWKLRQTCVWVNGGPNHDPIRFFPKTERVFWLAKPESSWLNNRKAWDVFNDYPDHVPLDGNGHTRTFPVSLVIKILNAGGFSTVLDPYCGSGTTGVACMQTGRNFIGIELDAGYCEIARRRIAEAANHLYAETP